MIKRIGGPISSDGSTTTIEQMKNLVKNTSKNLIAKVFSQEDSIGPKQGSYGISQISGQSQYGSSDFQYQK